MLDHERIALLALCCVDDSEVEAWMGRLLADEPNSEFQISNFRQDRSKQFVTLFRERFQFDVFGRRGAIVASTVLAELCRRTLRNEFPVPRLGDVVKKLDQEFNDAGLAYPEGLEELWNAFDWCDESWCLASQPWLPDVLHEVESKFGIPAAG